MNLIIINFNETFFSILIFQKELKFLLFILYIHLFNLGGGRKTQDPEMEKKLIEWYHECHDVQKIPLTAKMIKKKALEFSLIKEFSASKGWFEKFKKKYNLDVVRESSLKTIINH